MTTHTNMHEANANGAARFTRTGRCESCGEPSATVNRAGHCERCAELAQHADGYGATVALDMLRAAVIEAVSYASPAAITRAVTEAIEDASTG